MHTRTPLGRNEEASEWWGTAATRNETDVDLVVVCISMISKKFKYFLPLLPLNNSKQNDGKYSDKCVVCTIKNIDSKIKSLLQYIRIGSCVLFRFYGFQLSSKWCQLGYLKN